GAVDEDVVDAHRDQIDADRVVPVRQERDLQLRSDAVRGRDEHRLLQARGDPDEPGEAADVAEHLGAERAARERGDPTDALVAGIDVDARPAVREGLHGYAPNSVSCGVDSGPMPTR